MARRRSNETPPPAANPNVAALLTWLIPGAGHLMMGRATFGLIAFVVIEGLFYLGRLLTDGMLLQYLQPELRTSFAAALTPEAGNLGAVIWHMRGNPFATGFDPAPWPSTMQLGVFLSSLSGVLNLCLCVRAYSDAAFSPDRLKRFTHPATAVVFAWLVPGLGHWIVGRKLRGSLIFVMLVGMLVLGTILADGANLDREQHFYYWSGQFLSGSPAVLLELLFGGSRIRAEIAYVDAGLVFGCLAGLLNILAMMDAYTQAELALKDPEEAPASAETSVEKTADVGEVGASA